MLVVDILRQKGSLVHTIGPSATLDDVVQKLVICRCGSLVVCEADSAGEPQMVGIITERDILTTYAARRGSLAELRVCDVMTRDVLTSVPSDEIGEVMGRMTQHRVRHLPVFDGGRLAGMVSIGDVVKAQHREFELENHYLKSYISRGA